MSASAACTAEIASLLARTRQHAYEPDVIAEAAAALAGWGDSWRDVIASPVRLAELPLSLAGCLLAYAAAVEEDSAPALTIERLQREIARALEEGAWHAARADELRRKAEACAPAYRAGFLASSAGHETCARQRQLAAAQLRDSVCEIEALRRAKAA